MPGFVWSSVLSMLLPRRSVGKEVLALQLLTLSCINHGLWSWALVWIVRSEFLDHYPYLGGLFLAVIIFVSPVTLGLATAKLQQTGAVGGFLRRLGFRTVDSIPTAWDWYFSRQEPCWALVTLRSGFQVYGLLGAASFAGDDPGHRDLYLEASYRILPTGDWAPVEDTAGVLIMPDQIATIEFRKLNGDRP